MLACRHASSERQGIAEDVCRSGAYVESPGPCSLNGMSAYPYWSLNFDLRADLPNHVIRVLSDVAADRPPQPKDLSLLHPVVRFYLSDWRRMLVRETDPRVGSPIRLFRYWNADLGEADCLSIEFCQHDDEYANGGWVFWLWVLSLVHRPSPHPASGRNMIGFEGLYRGDGMPPSIYFVDHIGLDLGSRELSFQQVDESLETALDSDYEGYGSALEE